MTDAVVRKLDELISIARGAAIPLDAKWIDAEGVSAMLGFKHRYVIETIAVREDFPKAMRIDGSGHPRWLASEIKAWAEKHRAINER